MNIHEKPSQDKSHQNGDIKRANRFGKWLIIAGIITSLPSCMIPIRYDTLREGDSVRANVCGIVGDGIAIAATGAAAGIAVRENSDGRERFAPLVGAAIGMVGAAVAIGLCSTRIELENSPYYPQQNPLE